MTPPPATQTGDLYLRVLNISPHQMQLTYSPIHTYLQRKPFRILMPQFRKHANNTVKTEQAQSLYTVEHLAMLLIGLQMNAKFGNPAEVTVTKKLEVVLCQNFHK